jgi:esterase/lipase superfamily enzyme
VRTALLLVLLGVSAAGCGSIPVRHAATAHRRARHHAVVHYVRDHHMPVPILEYHVIGLHALGSPLEGL